MLHHGEMTTDRPAHIPVLLREVLDLLDPQPGDRVLDATVGLAGHAVELLKAVGSQGFLIGLDVDDANLEVARSVLRKVGENFILIRANFRDVRRALTEAGQGPVQRILADFGPSSNQFDAPGRGLSFQHDGPLDMRLDSRLPTTAADLVNRLSEHELSDLIYSNSQERFSRRIARQICRDRRDKRLTRTSELVGTVCRALKVSPTSHREKIHPATRVFQALRIAVNAELDAIAEFLPQIPALVTPGGRIAAISFHSLEDRLVKRAFRESKQQNIYTLITKQPVIADRQERQANPRSRSAKLRVAERTDQPIGT